jgi:membrane protease YdiL (CAAX protease family)
MKTLVTFFGLTFAATWTCFMAAANVADPQSLDLSFAFRGFLFLLGVFAPSYVAVFLTIRSEGRAGTEAFIKRLLRLSPGVHWYVFAIGFTATVKLTAAMIHRGIVGSWPPFGTDPWFVMLAGTLVSAAALGQAGEEVGWRGFALPKLVDRFGLPRASLFLGVIWAVWHLPLFFIDGTSTTGQSFPLYLLQVTALSVIMAWLYAKSGPGLWPVMLFHAAVNNTKDIVPSAVRGATDPFALSTSAVAWTTVALLWAVAVYLLFRMRTMQLRTG